jgi:hypothetical protein
VVVIVVARAASTGAGVIATGVVEIFFLSDFIGTGVVVPTNLHWPPAQGSPFRSFTTLLTGTGIGWLGML